MKEFDYYIFIDYSENFLGYLILDGEEIKTILPKISKFAHYKKLRHKSLYIHSIKKVVDKMELIKYFVKFKIKTLRDTPEIYADLVEFIRKNDNCIIFISVDDRQFSNFERLVRNIDGKNNKIVKESQLKKGSAEHRLSLVLDTLLNMERLKNESK
ncbi:hypothetical protein J4233_04620 [Candidatus Pacearchaeota archaeon]|nr:hypothetical protein [Candidatus Pacearchaeota archaeon]